MAHTAYSIYSPGRQRRNFPHLILCLVLPLIVSFSPKSNEWPCFHGKNRDNKSAETGLLKEWPREGPQLLWQTGGIGHGYSAVSIAQDKIFTAGMIDNETYVLCLDMEGNILWKQQNGTSWKAGENQRWAVSYAGSRSTPTIDGNWVYHLSELGQLSAFDLHTGEIQWTINIREKFKAGVPKYGYSESIFIHENMLFCCPGGDEAHIVAIDKQNGETIWKNQDLKDETGYSSVVPATIHEKLQLITFSAAHVFAADPRNGDLLWKYPFTNNRHNNATDVIVKDDSVLASSGYGKGCVLLKINKSDNGSFNPTKIWESNLLDNHHGGIIERDGYLYGAGHQSPGWTCLRFSDGAKMWQNEGKGSITYAENHIYCLDEKGTMSLIKTIPEEFKLMSSFDIDSDGTGPFWAHPVISNGKLYVRHADQLFVYKISAVSE